MRRIPLFLGLLLVFGGAGAAWATGFGGFGGDSPPSRIPIPAKDFTAVLEDQGGVEVKVTKATFNGEVFIYGTYGEGQMTVPFETIDTVRVEPSTEEGKVAALVVVKDGDSIVLQVDGDTPCYGATAFGNYAIEFQKLKTIKFPAQ